MSNKNTLNNLDNEFSVNTGKIYKNLCIQLASLDKEVIYKTERKIKEILVAKKLVFISYSENSSNRIDKIFSHYNLQSKVLDIVHNKPPTFLFKEPIMKITKNEISLFDKLNEKEIDQKSNEIKSHLYRYSKECVLDYDNDKENFEYFFALKAMLTKPMRLNEFLDYQLKKSFKSNKEKFNTFLSLLLIEYKSVITNDDTRIIINAYFKNKLPELEFKAILQTSVTAKNDEKKIQQFDSNFWNKECFDLFNYLAENYNTTAQKQKFINIWLYLEYHTNDSYLFNYIKEKYKTYILEKFNLDIKKMNKPNNFDSQLIILNNHYTNYCNKLKALK